MVLRTNHASYFTLSGCINQQQHNGISLTDATLFRLALELVLPVLLVRLLVAYFLQWRKCLHSGIWSYHGRSSFVLWSPLLPLWALFGIRNWIPLSTVLAQLDWINTFCIFLESKLMQLSACLWLNVCLRFIPLSYLTKTFLFLHIIGSF